MRNGISRASAGSNTTTASALIAPFLVAPSDSTSTPARQVSSAGVQPSAATALANRAPSMCTRRPWRCATSHSARDLRGRVQRAEIRRLREVERERLHARRVAAAGERERLVERRGLELEVAARQAHQLGAGEELGRAALVDVDVRRLVAVDRAVRVGERRERDRVRAGAARQREHLHRRARTARRSARSCRGCSRRRRRARPCPRWRPRAPRGSRGRRRRRCRCGSRSRFGHGGAGCAAEAEHVIVLETHAAAGCAASCRRTSTRWSSWTADPAGDALHHLRRADAARALRAGDTCRASSRSTTSTPLLGYWAAETPDGGEFVGWFHLRPDRIDAGEQEIGYRLRRAAWGQGYATEVRPRAGRARLRAGAGPVDLGARAARNAASRRVMEKCGLALRVAISSTAGGHAWPGRAEANALRVKYSITRPQWLAQRA